MTVSAMHIMIPENIFAMVASNWVKERNRSIFNMTGRKRLHA